MRKSKRKAQEGSQQPGIDPRTEQILRSALEPSTLSPIAPELAVAVGDSREGTPSSGQAPPLKPAKRGRDRKNRARDLTPVTVSDTHYHQGSSPNRGWAREADPPSRLPASANPLLHLRGLMLDLPIKAGTGEVQANLGEVALATLDYYQFGLSQPGGDSLPVGITNGAQSSAREDIAIIAGYLELEKRFRRVDPSLDSDHAASHLMSALVSQALEPEGSGNGDEEFVQHTVRDCLGGSLPRPVMATQGAAPGSDAPSEQPNRLIYRRPGA